ncbi:hypothetical protein [Corynebacterium fournieri]|uniref:hypothetical protein n=1 Tax=Corynebacterium fournieri TaxID=1852390 RepID=UPI000A2F2DEF|nr:hypothetical protein [Corynebacterium fournieri]WJY96740.1 hypothetical protein CFOUR_01510 [Corynebacterium fournieri]
MNPFAALIEAMSTKALATLADFDVDAALAAGFAPDKARAFGRLRETYYGKTTFTRKQATALSRAQGFSLDELALIERRLACVKSAAERWRLRLELLHVEGGYRAIERAARNLIPNNDTPARRQVAFSGSRNGRARITIDTTDRNAADLEHRLHQHIDPTQPAAPQMEDALWRILDGTDSGVVAAVPRPIVMVPLDAHTRILTGSGDDIELVLTDGTTMTGVPPYGSPHTDTTSATPPAEPSTNSSDHTRKRKTPQPKLGRDAGIDYALLA